MKKTIVLIMTVFFLFAAFQAGAQNQTGNVHVVGTIDYGAGQQCLVKTNAGGVAMIWFRHAMLDLDLQENRQFYAALKQASDYVDVVNTNNTSIRLTLNGGQLITSNDIKVIVDFTTDGSGGTESCIIPLTFSNPSFTEVVKFNQAQAQKLMGFLDECYKVSSSIDDELALFLTEN